MYVMSETFKNELNDLRNRMIEAIKRMFLSKGLNNKSIDFNGCFDTGYGSIDRLYQYENGFYVFESEEGNNYELDDLEADVLLWICYVIENEEYTESEQD